MRPKNNAGFTLIELMITVSIIAIIAAIAYPSYTGYVKKGRRADAKSALLSATLEIEKWKANHNYSELTDNTSAYFCDGDPTLCLTNIAGDTVTTSPDGYYSLSMPNIPTAPAYTIEATPPNTSIQYDDTDCRTFSINESGTKTAVDSDGHSNDDCW